MNPSVVKWRAFLDDIDLRQSLDKVEEEVDNWVASATWTARKFSHERGFSTDENVGGNENGHMANVSLASHRIRRLSPSKLAAKNSQRARLDNLWPDSFEDTLHAFWSRIFTGRENPVFPFPINVSLIALDCYLRARFATKLAFTLTRHR